MRPILYFIEYVVNNLFPLNEYSEGEIRYLMDKFKEEAEDFNITISDEDLKTYIKRFDTMKNSFDASKRDLRKWSLNQLLKAIRAKDKTTKDIPDDTPDVLYNQDGLIIYYGNKHGNCINYGNGENWCITRQTPNWANYRYGNEEVTFYLVKDTNKPDSNKDSFFVVHVLNNGLYRWTDRSNNPGQSESMNWAGLDRRFPVLQGKQSIFKYVPISDTERKSRGWKEAISFRDWLVNLDIEEKQIYLVTRLKQITSNHYDWQAKNIFNDISNSEFYKKAAGIDKIATWVSENPDIFKGDINNLFANIENFKPYHQRSLIKNLQGTLPASILKNDAYTWELKKALVKSGKIEKTNGSTHNFYYVFDESTIVLLEVDDNLKINLYQEDVNYDDIKINNRTAKYLAGYPKPDLPLSVITSTIKKHNLDQDLFSFDLGDENTVKIGDKNIVIRYSDFSAVDKDSKKVLSLNDPDIQKLFIEKVKTDPNFNNELLKALSESKNGKFFKSRGVDYKELIPIVKEMPKKDIKDYNVVASDKGIYLFDSPLIDNFDFKVPIIFNETNPFGSSDVLIDEDSIKGFNSLLTTQNKPINDYGLKRIFEKNEYGINNSTKVIFAKSNPPRTAGSTLEMRVADDSIYLVDTATPTESYRISKQTGKVLSAKGKVPGVRAVAQPRVAPLAAVPQAAPGVQPVAAGGGTVATMLGAEDLAHETTHTALRRFFQSQGTSLRPELDRGTPKRNAAVAGIGNVTRVIRSGQNACYIITLNNGDKIASVALQPEALHYILTDANIVQYDRVGQLSDAVRRLNLEENMKIDIKQLRRLIAEAVLEKYSAPAPSKPAPSRQPGIAEPPTRTKPEPKRRTLTPPEQAPKTKPKAEGKINESEKNILSKIVQRYKSR